MIDGLKPYPVTGIRRAVAWAGAGALGGTKAAQCRRPIASATLIRKLMKGEILCSTLQYVDVTRTISSSPTSVYGWDRQPVLKLEISCDGAMSSSPKIARSAETSGSGVRGG